MVQKRNFKFFAAILVCVLVCFATSACAKTSNLTKGQVIDLLEAFNSTELKEDTITKSVMQMNIKSRPSSSQKKAVKNAIAGYYSASTVDEIDEELDGVFGTKSTTYIQNSSDFYKFRYYGIAENGGEVITYYVNNSKLYSGDEALKVESNVISRDEEEIREILGEDGVSSDDFLSEDSLYMAILNGKKKKQSNGKFKLEINFDADKMTNILSKIVGFNTDVMTIKSLSMSTIISKKGEVTSMDMNFVMSIDIAYMFAVKSTPPLPYDIEFIYSQEIVSSFPTVTIV
jgi:hypothetical protein